MRNRILISTLLFTASCSAVDLPVVADVHVGPSATQAGALPNLLVGGGNKALLRFAMDVLPAGLNPAQVAKATLVFHVNRIATGGGLRVTQLNGAFDEMTVMAGNAPPAFGFSFGVTPVQGLNLVDVTPVVQQWLAVPGAAFGFELAAANGASTSLQVDSRENTATSFGAELRVVLTGPAGPQGPQGIAGAAGATGATGATGPSGQNDPQMLSAVCAILGKMTVPTGLICPPKTVFVTGGTYTGNIGGLAKADQICRLEAEANGLTGTYKAWLSTAQNPVSQRFTPTAGQYKLVTGTVIANGFADLTDGQLLAPVNRAANGQLVTTDYVWTGTTTSGSAEGKDCSGWTTASTAISGTAGLNPESGIQWTMSVWLNCSLSLRLYCFEQ
ncbi:MAG: DNRLRE domain-containing protein [Bryobacteraceae bacterium]